MYTGKSEYSMIKETLKDLSCNNGWSYGVFWRFDQTNSLLLTLQEAYFEEEMGVVIDDMLLQVHVVGGGVIGQAAFAKKHTWIFSDTNLGTQTAAGSVDSSDTFQDHCELDSQFSVGIKTIAVIPVEPLGVVQFGSTQKIPETLEFVYQTKELFRGIEIVQGLFLPESEQSSSNSDTCGMSGLFTSLIAYENPNFVSPKLQRGDSCGDLIETSFCAANMSQSFPSTSDCQKVNDLAPESSPCEDRFGIANAKAHIYSNGNQSGVQSQPSRMESATFFGFSSSQGPYMNSTWSFGDIQESPIYSSGCSSGLFADIAKTSQKYSRDTVSSQNFGPSLHSGEGQIQRPSSLYTFEDLRQNNVFAKSLSKYCPTDELLHWFSPTTDKSKEMVTTAVSNDLSYASGITSLSSNPKGYCTPAKIISDNQTSSSVQSSTTNAFYSAEEEKCSGIIGNGKLFDKSGVDQGSKTLGNWDILMPFVNGGQLDFSVSTSECISEIYSDPKLGTANTLFSKLGLYQHFDGRDRGPVSVARADFDDHLSSPAKRRKIESSLLSRTQVKCLPSFDGNINTVQSIYNRNSTKNLGSKDEVIKQLEAGLCIGDSSSITAGHSISSPKKQEPPAKSIKKKAKPGSKPRPKDRQQIYERLLELRELIPNGEKMSIDRLLHRTIKHLLFLQSVTRHAEKFEQTDEPKSVMFRKQNHSSSNGVTWACEVENETMFCPLIVEDLSVPGQMLIEILCEEQGFFLEIVDIIRGFGLTILKGVMEVRESKIWGRFTVETEENQHVTRHEIFSSLVQLLQLTGPNEVHKSAQLGNTIDGGASLFDDCQQAGVPLPVNLGNKF